MCMRGFISTLNKEFKYIYKKYAGICNKILNTTFMKFGAL
jgi:hypothetical protein